VKQEYQTRFLLYCEYTKQKPKTANLTDYIIFISKLAGEYKKQNNLTTIIDHDDFNTFIKKEIGGGGITMSVKINKIFF